MTEYQSRERLSMERHPDILALRERYEQVSQTWVAQSIDGLALLAGVFAAIAPWVVGFQSRASTLATTDLIVGAAIALLAFGLATAYERTHGMSPVMAAMGVWLIVAPWAVQGTDRTDHAMLVTQIIVGACVVVLGLAAAGLGTRRFTMSGARARV